MEINWVINCCNQSGICMWMNFFMMICLVNVLVIVEFCLEVSNVMVKRVESVLDLVILIKILLFNIDVLDNVL